MQVICDCEIGFSGAMCQIDLGYQGINQIEINHQDNMQADQGEQYVDQEELDLDREPQYIDLEEHHAYQGEQHADLGEQHADLGEQVAHQEENKEMLLQLQGGSVHWVNNRVYKR